MIGLRHYRRQFASVEVQASDLNGGAVARLIRLQHPLPHAILGVVEDGVAALDLGIHLEQQLVPLRPHIDHLLVEWKLKLVDPMRIHLDTRLRQAIARLHRRHLPEERRITRIIVIII